MALVWVVPAVVGGSAAGLVLGGPALRGARCPRCAAQLHLPPAAAAAGGLPAGIGWVAVAGAGVTAWAVAGVLAVAGVCAAVDVRHRIIPNRLVLPAAAVLTAGLAVGAAAGERAPLIGAAAGLAVCALPLAMGERLRPGAIGMGDVKLAGLLGVASGAAGGVNLAVRVLLLAVVAGGVGATAILLGRDRGGGPGRRGTGFAFGPCLVAGALAACLMS